MIAVQDEEDPLARSRSWARSCPVKRRKNGPGKIRWTGSEVVLGGPAELISSLLLHVDLLLPILLLADSPKKTKEEEKGLGTKEVLKQLEKFYKP
jgi:hypothetical protein